MFSLLLGIKRCIRDDYIQVSVKDRIFDENKLIIFYSEQFHQQQYTSYECLRETSVPYLETRVSTFVFTSISSL